jgi:signal transduction histidine kinase/ActR/RegA family two-component response regulator
MSSSDRLVEHGPGGTLSFRDDGRITLASPGLHRMLGAAPGSLLGRRFESLLSPASRVYHSTQLLPLLKLSGMWTEIYLQLRTEAGDDVDVLASAARDPADELSLAHCMLMPMGKRKQLEAALVEAKRTAESATAAKDQFLAVISHELRTPLSAILGWARIGQTDKMDAGMLQQAFQTIERNANAQARLIDDLLDISRIVSGKMRLSPRAIDLAPVVEAAIDTARPSAKAKNVSLIGSVDRTPHVVFADPDRIQQIVWNLLTNAIKFTPKGGSVQVTLIRVGSRLQLGVSDTGEGIAADKLPFVFERFWQVGAFARKNIGLGLGLAICKSLVELHGGTIHAESDGIGHGASFSVELPLAVSSTSLLGKATQRGDSADASPLAVSLNGLRVLVVDDDQDTRELMTMLLRAAGAKVTTAGSFDEAIAALQIVVPDVLLSDVGLAGQDGYELIRQIRAGLVPEARGLPAIAVTGLSRAQDRVTLLRAGFQAHLSKPVEPSELNALIAAIGRKI